MTAAGVKALELLPGLVIQTKFEPKIQEHVSCGCCGSDQYETLHHFPENYFDPEWFDTYSWDANLGLELRIVECKDCGLIYQNKRFSQEALHQLSGPAINKQTLAEAMACEASSRLSSTRVLAAFQ